MATNPYFESSYTASDADQELFNDLIVESIKVHGRDMYYLPRTLTNFDSFFGEDAISAFNDAVVVEFYLENVMGWEGEGKFFSKFGFELQEEAVLIVARSRFKEEVSTKFPYIPKPRAGDVIVFPSEVDQRRRAFEITYAAEESVFYQLGELYIWKLTVRNFSYNGESFNTGIPGIDEYTPDNSIAMSIELATGAGDFEIGETVVQDNWSAQVVGFNDNVLTVITTAGELNYEEIIMGQSSFAAWRMNDVKDTNAKDNGADNKYLKDAVDDGLVNFSESNPFSGY